MFKGQWIKISVFLFSLLLALPGFAKEKLIKEKRSVPSFSEIDVSGLGTVTLKQGSKEQLIIQSTAETLPQITSEVRNNCLFIGPKENHPLNSSSVHYYITVKDIQKITATGNIEITSQGTLTTKALTLGLEGKGRARLSLKTDCFNGKISGSGEMIAQGTTRELQMAIEGSGSLQGKKLSTQVSTVSIYGSGSTTVRTAEELNVKIAGSGQVKYYGNPKIIQQVSGSGEIIPLE